MYYFFFLMIRRPPRSTLDRSSAASDVYKRQAEARAGVRLEPLLRRDGIAAGRAQRDRAETHSGVPAPAERDVACRLAHLPALARARFRGAVAVGRVRQGPIRIPRAVPQRRARDEAALET